MKNSYNSGLVLILVLVLTLTLVGCGSNKPTPTPPPPNPLVAHYTMNGNANDSSGNGYNGTVHSGVSLTIDRLGQANKAYNFDGSANGYIEIPRQNFITGNAVSVSAWFKIVNFDTVDSRVYFIAGGDFKIYYRSINDGAFGLIGLVTDTGDEEAEYPSSDTWVHVVWTFDGTRAMTYVNGSQTGSRMCSTIANPGSTTLTIGVIPPDTGLSCQIDDFRIYNKTLSENEIIELYNYND